MDLHSRGIGFFELARTDGIRESCKRAQGKHAQSILVCDERERTDSRGSGGSESPQLFQSHSRPLPSRQAQRSRAGLKGHRRIPSDKRGKGGCSETVPPFRESFRTQIRPVRCLLHRTVRLLCANHPRSKPLHLFRHNLRWTWLSHLLVRDLEGLETAAVTVQRLNRPIKIVGL